MRGQLFFVVGNSGSGKDSVMKYAAEHYGEKSKLKIARRIITRPPSPETEDFDSVSVLRFWLLRLRGRLAFLWKSYGKWYGISKDEIEGWLEQGNHVLINVSREILFKDKDKYPNSHIAYIFVPLEVLKKRLEKRGREGREEISRRLERAEKGVELPEGYYTIENTGTLEQAGNKLIAYVKRTASEA